MGVIVVGDNNRRQRAFTNVWAISASLVLNRRSFCYYFPLPFHDLTVVKCNR